MCTFHLLDGLLHSARMVLLLKMHPLLFLQRLFIKRIRIYPPPPAMGWVFSTTSNIRPMSPSTTSLSHPVPESTNRYSILTIYDANDDPTDTSPKQGIIVGPYMNEDLESDRALPKDHMHAEVALR